MNVSFYCSQISTVSLHLNVDCYSYDQTTSGIEWEPKLLPYFDESFQDSDEYRTSLPTIYEVDETEEIIDDVELPELEDCDEIETQVYTVGYR